MTHCSYGYGTYAFICRSMNPIDLHHDGIKRVIGCVTVLVVR